MVIRYLLYVRGYFTCWRDFGEGGGGRVNIVCGSCSGVFFSLFRESVLDYFFVGFVFKRGLRVVLIFFSCIFVTSMAFLYFKFTLCLDFNIVESYFLFCIWCRSFFTSVKESLFEAGSVFGERRIFGGLGF